MVWCQLWGQKAAFASDGTPNDIAFWNCEKLATVCLTALKSKTRLVLQLTKPGSWLNAVTKPTQEIQAPVPKSFTLPMIAKAVAVSSMTSICIGFLAPLAGCLIRAMPGTSLLVVMPLSRLLPRLLLQWWAVRRWVVMAQLWTGPFLTLPSPLRKLSVALSVIFHRLTVGLLGPPPPQCRPIQACPFSQEGNLVWSPVAWLLYTPCNTFRFKQCHLFLYVDVLALFLCAIWSLFQVLWVRAPTPVRDAL